MRLGDGAVTNDYREILSTAWTAITTGGLVAGLVATAMQFLGFQGYASAAAFVLILVFFSLTAFNVLLFRAAHRMRPVTRFIEGHDAVFDALTVAVAGARDSIWASRVTQSTVDVTHDYFATTIRRIKGQNCRPIINYRRVMSVSSRDKAELMVTLLRQHANDRPFALRTTDLELDFEIVITDHSEAFLLFHDPESASSVINSALQIFDRGAIERVRGLFNAMWRHAEVVKDGPTLSDAKCEQFIAKYQALAEELPE